MWVRLEVWLSEPHDAAVRAQTGKLLSVVAGVCAQDVSDGKKNTIENCTRGHLCCVLTTELCAFKL